VGCTRVDITRRVCRIRAGRRIRAGGGAGGGCGPARGHV